MKIDDHLTHIDNPEDIPFLKQPLFDVNIRLLKSSYGYRLLINKVSSYIAFLAEQKFLDYKKPHGTSGANAGIPLNIIAVVRDRDKKTQWVEEMINPKILEYGEEKIITNSNCGSIRLKEPIKVQRSKTIVVEWYTSDAVYKKEKRTIETGSLTIQHEVDHNLGVLITDRKTTI